MTSFAHDIARFVRSFIDRENEPLILKRPEFVAIAFYLYRSMGILTDRNFGEYE